MNKKIYAVICAMSVFGLTIPVYGTQLDFDRINFDAGRIVEQLGDEPGVLPVPYPAEADYADPAAEVIKRSLAGSGRTSGSEYEFGVQTTVSRPPRSKEEFCARVSDPAYFKRLILDRGNRLAFSNYGGFANGGVCWWHSRLTRRATYLTVYRPDLPKPTKKQVLEIFDAYFWNNRVVEVPGYRNLQEFSNDWEDVLHKKLEDWQALAGTIGFEWIGGLSGSTKVSAKKLKKDMDKLFEEVRTKNKIVYQKLQMPGIPVHAWLVVDMKKTSDGYVLRVIDSNYHSAVDVSYRIGNQCLYAYGHLVPYTEFQGEWDKSRAAQKRYCR